ncbi:hypothetical protein H6503_06955 [Candidatus Woesearchaeota archaeon]|nr:hypothetical protein [Candidatus Woesearchaeota archaeon]
MSIEMIIGDMIQHGLAGMAFPVLDYVSTRATNPRDKRMEKKTEVLQSISRLLDAEKESQAVPPESLAETDESLNASPLIPKGSLQYAENVQVVREFLLENGKIKMDLPLGQKIKYGFMNLVYHEKINNLGARGKGVLAVALEVADSFVGLEHYSEKFGASPVGAWYTNLWQVGALWGGLMLGKPVTRLIDWTTTSRDEKKLNRAISESLKGTPILDIIVNYDPPQSVADEMDKKGMTIYTSKLTEAGQSLYKRVTNYAGRISDGAKGAVNAISEIGERREESRRKKHEETERYWQNLP